MAREGDGTAATGSGDGASADGDATAADGPSGAGSGSGPPPDVGDGSDDDTLAAQLRELAMKEQDSVLRERYWDEYRRHKGID